MAKDPAFLFYPGDWLGGTMLLNRHQKGCYIDLLMAQFNYGPLSLDQIKTVLGQDQASWTVLREKFRTDNCGRFFNEKLATEIEKRKKFVGSRSNNKSGRKKSYDKSYDSHMNSHMENENENEFDVLKRGSGENNSPPAFDQFPRADTMFALTDADIGGSIQYVQLLTKRLLVAEDVERKFKAFRLQHFNGTKFYESRADIMKHFRDWLKHQKNDDNGNSKHRSKAERSVDTASELVEEVLGRNPGLSAGKSYPGG